MSAPRSMQEAIISGFFRKDGKPLAQPALEAARKQRKPQQQRPDKSICAAPQPDFSTGPEVRMDAILATAAEVAAGMLYLHARSIVHGDLTGANVLLQECPVSLSTLLLPVSPLCTHFWLGEDCVLPQPCL